MSIGIVVYSWTGNTLSVAESLKEKLSDAGHSVTLEKVTVVGERERGSREFELGTRPDVTGYDAVIFGAAVEAFSLSPVLKAYLEQVDSLEGKTVGCLVTQQFPYPWLGGNRAIRQMKKLVKAKGATVGGSAVAHWAASKRQSSIAAAVESLANLF